MPNISSFRSAGPLFYLLKYLGSKKLFSFEKELPFIILKTIYLIIWKVWIEVKFLWKKQPEKKKVITRLNTKLDIELFKINTTNLIFNKIKKYFKESKNPTRRKRNENIDKSIKLKKSYKLKRLKFFG